MVELTQTNDPVLLSWLVAVLADVRIEAVVFGSHTSILEGSVFAIPRRLMVDDSDLARARRILAGAEEIGRSTGP
jgi:hypothetical protein